jgi:hypothetical protein
MAKEDRRRLRKVARPGARVRVLLSLPPLFFLAAALMAAGGRLFQAGTPHPPNRAGTAALLRLYLTPGGRYTAADIRANGYTTPADKFQGILANHHLHPVVGERICPITHTRANPRFAWVIGNRRYLFCCPPCIDEFVQQAKTAPASIRPPAAYVQR